MRSSAEREIDLYSARLLTILGAGIDDPRLTIGRYERTCPRAWKPSLNVTACRCGKEPLRSSAPPSASGPPGGGLAASTTTKSCASSSPRVHGSSSSVSATASDRFRLTSSASLRPAAAPARFRAGPPRPAPRGTLLSLPHRATAGGRLAHLAGAPRALVATRLLGGRESSSRRRLRALPEVQLAALAAAVGQCDALEAVAGALDARGPLGVLMPPQPRKRLSK